MIGFDADNARLLDGRLSPVLRHLLLIDSVPDLCWTWSPAGTLGARNRPIRAFPVVDRDSRPPAAC
jgi:hypothetical protein